jgi:hypothetical protein
MLLLQNKELNNCKKLSKDFEKNTEFFMVELVKFSWDEYEISTGVELTCRD